ncbi:MAG: amidohydrolase family protein [Candidatus Dormibacteraceae bacterium]
MAVADGSNSYAVLDVHQHVPVDEEAFEQDRIARVGFMDRFGIDQACVSPPVLPPRRVSTADLNRGVSHYARAFPDRFPFALGTMDIRGGDKELQELESFRRLGLSGVVWHHMFQGAFLDHPLMSSALEYCRRAGLPAFIHVMAGSLLESMWRLGRLCEAFPEVSFVAMDALSTPHQADWAIEAACHFPNLFADTGVLTSYGNPVERFAAAVGPERLLLGTDFDTSPKAFNFPYAVYEVVHSTLTTRAKQDVLAGNARRLLGS